MIQIEKISRDFLISNMVVPISVNNEEFCFSAAVPQDPFISKALSMALGDVKLKLVLGLETDINKALQICLKR